MKEDSRILQIDHEFLPLTKKHELFPLSRAYHL
jgi:hypothetical protein